MLLMFPLWYLPSFSSFLFLRHSFSLPLSICSLPLSLFLSVFLFTLLFSFSIAPFSLIPLFSLFYLFFWPILTFFLSSICLFPLTDYSSSPFFFLSLKMQFPIPPLAFSFPPSLLSLLPIFKILLFLLLPSLHLTSCSMNMKSPKIGRISHLQTNERTSEQWKTDCPSHSFTQYTDMMFKDTLTYK